jgi:hypothetical protein
MTEKLTLIFNDGTRFEWKTSSIRDGMKAIKLQKSLGDPIDIIGDGKVAQTLREKYKVYNQNPQAYKMDVFGTASKLSGIGKEEIQQKIEKVKKLFRR